MFEIEYRGGNTVVIATKKASLVVDPKQSLVGLKDLLVKDSIELATEPRFALGSATARLCLEGPGDYEVADFSIRGVSAQRHLDTETDEQIATIYRIEIGDVRLALIGNINEKLSEDQLEALGVVDIVILPVGGTGYTLDATGAASLVRRIDPKVVIPVHYADKTLKYEVTQDELRTFVSELGAPVETVPKYKVKGNSSIPAVLTVVEVTRS
jgi:L-ascorbate metabolism protein UlaG (beta-lactamase superfamily)